MNKFARSIAMLLPLLLLFGCCAPPSLAQKTISKIYISILGVGFIETEYQVDLENYKLYYFHTQSNHIEVRNPKETNEGYQTVTDISPDKISAFREEAKEYAFADWNESYMSEKIYDGHHWYQWGITITFADGTEKKIAGRNEFPKTWDAMDGAFQKLGVVIFASSK